jgi:hypothetical protein
MVQGTGYRVQGIGYKVQGALRVEHRPRIGFKVLGCSLVFRVRGFGFGVWSLGFGARI